MDRKMLLAVLVLGLLGIRCAHTPKTPDERACKLRVDGCMKRCAAEPQARDPQSQSPSAQGCDGDIRTQCEEHCYAMCEW